MDANWKKLALLMYWTLIPIVMLFTTAAALDSISSPSTYRLILGILTLTINTYVIFTYIRLGLNEIYEFISKENENA